MPVGRGTLPDRRGESGLRKVSDSRAHLLGGEAVDVECRCLGFGRFRRVGRIGQQYAMRRAQIVAGCLDLVAGKPGIAGWTTTVTGACGAMISACCTSWLSHWPSPLQSAL